MDEEGWLLDEQASSRALAGAVTCTLLDSGTSIQDSRFQSRGPDLPCKHLSSTRVESLRLKLEWSQRNRVSLQAPGGLTAGTAASVLVLAVV